MTDRARGIHFLDITAKFKCECGRTFDKSTDGLRSNRDHAARLICPGCGWVWGFKTFITRWGSR